MGRTRATTTPDPPTGDDVEPEPIETDVVVGEVVYIHRAGPDNHEGDYVTIGGNPGPIPAIVVRDHGANVITVTAFPEGREPLPIRSLAKRTAELLEDRRRGMSWDVSIDDELAEDDDL